MFTCFPNGLGLLLKKIILNKVPIISLHFKNVPLSGYIDGFFTEGDIFSICEENLHKTMRLYDKFDLENSQTVAAQKLSDELSENDHYTFPRKDVKTKN